MIKIVSTIIFFTASLLLTITAINFSQDAYSDYQIKRLPIYNEKLPESAEMENLTEKELKEVDFNETVKIADKINEEVGSNYNQLLNEAELVEFSDEYIQKGEELKSAYLNIDYLNQEAVDQPQEVSDQGIDYWLDNLGVNGNFSGRKTWLVRNNQNQSGRLLLGLSDLINLENGCNDQEKSVDKNCQKLKDKGELGGKIKLVIALDGIDKVSSYLLENQQNKISKDWNKLPAVVIRPHQSRLVTAYWSVGENDYGNEIQGDSVEFNLNFRMVKAK